MTTNAESPFDPGNKYADIILRSSDLVDFYFNKLFLITSSAFFADMLSLSQPSVHEIQRGLPVVEMMEESRILYPLLMYCYPQGPFTYKATTAEDACALFEVARKYMVEGLKRYAYKLFDQHSGDSEMFRPFALAVAYGEDDEADAVARKLLRTQLYVQQYVPELELITASDFLWMLKHRSACASAATAVIEAELSPNGLSTSAGRWSFNCGRCKENGGEKPKWLRKYLEVICNAVGERPYGEVVLSRSLKDTVKEGVGQCSTCFPNIPLFEEYTQYIAQEVDRATSSVLPFCRFKRSGKANSA